MSLSRAMLVGVLLGGCTYNGKPASDASRCGLACPSDGGSAPFKTSTDATFGGGAVADADTGGPLDDAGSGGTEVDGSGAPDAPADHTLGHDDLVVEVEPPQPDGPPAVCSAGSSRCGPDETPQICAGGQWVSGPRCRFHCVGDGQCGPECVPPAAICDGAAARKVCGADLTYHSEACPGVSGGAGTCKAGVCDISCNPEFHRCNSEDRCAADDDASNCGATCLPCGALAGGRIDCVSGQCVGHCALVTEKVCGAACEGLTTIPIPLFSQDCGGTSQTCNRRDVTVINVLGCSKTVALHLQLGPESCASAKIEVFANGISKGWMGPMDKTQIGTVALGRFPAGTMVSIAVQLTGVLGGCDVGVVVGWAGSGSVDLAP
jgi:hypothetical protein